MHMYVIVHYQRVIADILENQNTDVNAGIIMLELCYPLLGVAWLQGAPRSIEGV